MGIQARAPGWVLTPRGARLPVYGKSDDSKAQQGVPTSVGRPTTPRPPI